MLLMSKDHRHRCRAFAVSSITGPLMASLHLSIDLGSSNHVAQAIFYAELHTRTCIPYTKQDGEKKIEAFLSFRVSCHALTTRSSRSERVREVEDKERREGKEVPKRKA
jgi:hypothetical protein